jgi:hypothetical protein
VSVEELWPQIYLLDEANLEGTSAVLTQDSLGDQASHSCTDPQRSRRIGEGSLCVNRRAPIDGAPGSSSTPPRRCGGGSVKNKAARNLADAFGAILPRMRCSFVD